jgi:selenide,water dikinase
VDFFAPIVDDPYTFGRIAAANSLSDVYAMGGVPITVMNIVAFPVKTMPMEVLKDILRGGLDATQDAGALLVGGHSVDDGELKYGLSVAGTVHPDRILTNEGAKPGDVLFLTKPIGTGIIATALKKDAATLEAVEAMVQSMTTLNRAASEAMQEVGVNACTDITGFGLLGHAMEMAKGSKLTLVIEASKVPLLEETLAYAARDMVPGGAKANREFFETSAKKNTVADELYTSLWDPQTSGGLLIAVPEKKADPLRSALLKHGASFAAQIGRCVAGPAGIEVLA